MSHVQSSSRMPAVRRSAGEKPGDVLCQRVSSSGGGAALGVSASSSRVSRVSAASVLSQLRSRTGSVELAVSASRMASALHHSVASPSEYRVESASVALESLPAATGPKGTLSSVFEGLRRSSKSAKVLRGRLRLTKPSVQSEQCSVGTSNSVASELVQFRSKMFRGFASKSFESSGVASIGSASVAVASQFVSVACELSQLRSSSVRVRNLH